MAHKRNDSNTTSSASALTAAAAGFKGIEPDKGPTMHGKAVGPCTGRLAARLSPGPGPVVKQRNTHELEEGTVEPPAKKRRVEPDLSNLDHPDNNSHRHISLNVRRTCNILASWAPHVQEVKQRFINHLGCPEFPYSEWDNIITGQPVNLDVVLCDVYAGPEPATVTTASDWLAAWRRLAEAYRFAFPHRKSELDTYGMYINTMFSSYITESHSQIINFDKAIRKRVGSCRNLELSNVKEFMGTHTSYFSPFGRNYIENTKAASKGKVSDRKELCRRWNTGACTFSSSSCHRIHACSVQGCNSSNHPACEHEQSGCSPRLLL